MAPISVSLETTGLNNRLCLQVYSLEMKSISPVAFPRMQVNPSVRANLIEADNIKVELFGQIEDPLLLAELQ